MILLFDTNVLLDVLLEREPFFESAARLWGMAEKKQLDGHISALSCNTVYYVARKSKGREVARNAMGLILGIFKVAGVDQKVLDAAYASPLHDFEDAVQLASAEPYGVTHLVTRDLNNFQGSKISVVSPDQCVALIAVGGTQQSSHP